MIEFLTLEDVLETHREQIQVYGGIDGIRDPGLLESAMAQPQAQFGGVYLHEDLCAMAAAYLFHLVQNHPFLDGNKRVGLETALLFLEINGFPLNVTSDELIDLVLQTAQGRKEKSAISEFFRQHRA